EIHLKILADRYLSFFRKRKKIEEVYVDSLRKLYYKAKVADASFDSRIESSTVQRLYSEWLKDNLERETRSRQAFMNMLVVDVINPLATLKDIQDRERKRVKDDLKESAVAYADYAENTLPKLKKGYFKKCQEYKVRLPHLSTPFLSHISDDTIRIFAWHLPNLKIPAPTSLTSRILYPTQPPRIRDRKSSGHGSHNRTLSNALSFSDLAQHGNALKAPELVYHATAVDKEGSIRGGNDDLAARSARAKQEAEVADNEYRKSVHWLWGLRSRRVKALEEGYNSLERIAFETTETVKKVLVKYTETTVTTCTAHTELAIHARSEMEKISAKTDTSVLATSLRSSFALSIPPRTLYYNYDVGECLDLVFGVSLADYAAAQEGQKSVSNIRRLCIEEVDKRGLEVERIYMVSPSTGQWKTSFLVFDYKHAYSRNAKSNEISFNSDADDIHTAASLLKFYLKELPEPLFSFPLQSPCFNVYSASHTADGFAQLRSRICGLPAVHRASLGALLWHLSRVASHSNKNRMGPKDLALIFAPLVFGDDEVSQGGFLIGQPQVRRILFSIPDTQVYQDSVMMTLIDSAHILLGEYSPCLSSFPSPICSRGRTPVIDDDSFATSTMVEFPQIGGLTPQSFFFCNPFECVLGCITLCSTFTKQPLPMQSVLSPFLP
ncbi:hypothetical protein EI94DRAFT_1649994, partial [Lactarius quietus]